MLAAIASIENTKIKGNGYVLHLLREVRKIADLFVVCVSDETETEFLNAIKAIADDCQMYSAEAHIIRWKDVLLNRINPEQYDVFLLLDDSCFGPLYSLEILKKDIEDSKADFWGLYLNGECVVEDGISVTSRPPYMPMNFFALSRRIVQDQRFRYWLCEIEEKEKTKPEGLFLNELQYETDFTSLAEEWGYLCKAYVKDTVSCEPRFYIPLLLLDSHRLISEYQYPFLPVRLFDIEKIYFRTYNLGNEAQKCISWIKDSEYDVNFIYDYLIANKDPSELVEILNMNFILPSCQAELSGTVRGAVLAYLFFEDLFEYSIHMLENVPAEFDIYIATNTEEKKQQIEEIFGHTGCGNKLTVLLHKNKGRDLAALLVLFKPFLMDYEIICYMHDKKSSQMLYPTVGADFNRQMWECMLHDPEYVKRVVNLLLENERLGFLGMSMVEHGMYFHTSIDSWTICYLPTVELIKTLGLDVVINGNYNPLSLGSSFWCKTAALEKLFRTEFTYEDFPDEPMPVDGTISHCIERLFPYVAADAGYYSGTIRDLQAAESVITVHGAEHSVIMKRLDCIKNVNAATFQSTVESLYSIPFKEKIILDSRLLDGRTKQYSTANKLFSSWWDKLYVFMNSHKTGRQLMIIRKKIKKKLAF
ncbi:MAG: hypothetical protein IKF90_26265 [Parasporobacterium sp.]|nr:hypothetical protein [Parasporobacterium sp.]